MEHWFTLYLITRLDAIGNISITMTFLFVLAAFAVAGITYVECEFARAKQPIKNMLIAAACSLAVFVLTPSQKDVMFIAGGVGVIEAAKSETAQRVASKSVEAVERWLDSVSPKKE